MSLLLGALIVGLILSLLALGVFVSFRIFSFPDMTAEGTVTLGAAVAAAGGADFIGRQPQCAHDAGVQGASGNRLAHAAAKRKAHIADVFALRPGRAGRALEAAVVNTQ